MILGQRISEGGKDGGVIDNEGGGPCFAVVLIADVVEVGGEVFGGVAVGSAGMEEVGGGQIFDTLSAVEVNGAISGDGHSERPPAWCEGDAADFLSEIISANEEESFILGEATIVGAVEFDEEAGPVVFLFSDVFGEEEDFFFFGDGGLEVDAVAEVASGAIFPLVEGGKPDAGQAAGSSGGGNHADTGGAGHDEVILFHLHGVEVGYTGVECLDFECAAAAGESKWGGIDADDVVWLSAFWAFEPAAI